MEYFFNLNQIIELVVKAGDFAKEHHGKVVRDQNKETHLLTNTTSTYQEEKSAFSFVDAECQKIIMKGILELYPQKFGLIAEEQNEEIIKLSSEFIHQNELPENQYTLLIDPIDGTSNYCSAHPQDPNHEKKKKQHLYWGVSLAIAYGKEIIAGVIYYPVLTKDGIILKTQKNRGTHINNTKIELSHYSSFSPQNPIRISGALNNPQLNTLFPNRETYGAFVVTFLALLKGNLENPPAEFNSLNPIPAYIGENSNPLDIGCCALAYQEAGGTIRNKNNELLNLFHYVSFSNPPKINTFFIMAPNQEYSKSLINYFQQNSITFFS